ncbi:MAG: hypothetical protein RL329_3246 [Bacteroidota bacterium]
MESDWGGTFVFNWGSNKYLKILLRTKHCAATSRKPQRKGSTARGCVSAIVLNHFLSIYNIERALFH